MTENKVMSEDLQNRIKAFNEKLLPLLKEYKLILGAIPFITNDGRVGATAHVFDEPKDLPKPADAVNTPTEPESNEESLPTA